jgi:hypothetical protein
MLNQTRVSSDLVEAVRRYVMLRLRPCSFHSKSAMSGQQSSIAARNGFCHERMKGTTMPSASTKACRANASVSTSLHWLLYIY